MTNTTDFSQNNSSRQVRNTAKQHSSLSKLRTLMSRAVSRTSVVRVRVGKASFKAWESKWAEFIEAGQRFLSISWSLDAPFWVYRCHKQDTQSGPVWRHTQKSPHQWNAPELFEWSLKMYSSSLTFYSFWKESLIECDPLPPSPALIHPRSHACNSFTTIRARTDHYKQA